MSLDKRLEQVLVDIDFVARYSSLSERYPRTSRKMKNPDIRRVADLIEKIGYDCSYQKNGKFFSIPKSKINGFGCYLNLAVSMGFVEFILSLSIDGEGGGGPYDFVCRDVDGSHPGVPFFSSYEELEEIFREGFTLFEEIDGRLAEKVF